MASNTLILYDLDPACFANLESALVPQITGLAKWCELKSFGRILAVFVDENAAASAHTFIKTHYSSLKTVHGDRMEVNPAMSYLSLPDPGRLLFTSPPASPPNGWEPAIEDAPNTFTNFEDEFNKQLAQALFKVQTASLESPELPPQQCQKCSAVLYESPGKNVPAIKIEWEDCGDSQLSPLSPIPRTCIPSSTF